MFCQQVKNGTFSSLKRLPGQRNLYDVRKTMGRLKPFKRQKIRKKMQFSIKYIILRIPPEVCSMISDLTAFLISRKK